MSAPSPAERLQSTAAPWVHLLVADGNAALPAPPLGFVERALDGRRCADEARPPRRVRPASSRFPRTSGARGTRSRTASRISTWLPGAGYRLVIRAADRLLPAMPRLRRARPRLLEDVGRAWGTAATGHPGRGAVPFHTVLMVPAMRLGTRRNWRAPRLTG